MTTPLRAYPRPPVRDPHVVVSSSLVPCSFTLLQQTFALPQTAICSRYARPSLSIPLPSQHPTLRFYGFRRTSTTPSRSQKRAHIYSIPSVAQWSVLRSPQAEVVLPPRSKQWIIPSTVFAAATTPPLVITINGVPVLSVHSWQHIPWLRFLDPYDFFQLNLDIDEIWIREHPIGQPVVGPHTKRTEGRLRAVLVLVRDDFTRSEYEIIRAAQQAAWRIPGDPTDRSDLPLESDFDGTLPPRIEQ